VPRPAVAIPVLVSALAGGCAAAPPRADAWLACAFVPVEEEARDVIAHCARRGEDGALGVQPAALDVLGARGTDPAPVRIGNTLHYLNASGVAAPVLAFDNGADGFVEGLARTLRDGKVGFIDEELRVVIPPSWDFAFPFANGTAVVCDGCTFRPVGDGHREVVGGLWGLIDARGRVVVPVVHTREDLAALREAR
jgi:WG containing repeat